MAGEHAGTKQLLASHASLRRSLTLILFFLQHHNTLQVSRQKLPADWHKRLQAIQAKVTEAVKDLPAGLLAQLPGGADAAVDYFRAVQIRDKLAETGERTLFGGLSGQAGTWDKIVKAYENGGVCVCRSSGSVNSSCTDTGGQQVTAAFRWW